jgi:RHS repeat-associated protein
LRDEGTYADKETNLVYNWNRYRDTDSGRFIQADPLGLDGGDLSLYVLRKNSPLLFTDPYGLQSEIEGGRGSGFPGWLNPSAQAQQRLARQLSRLFKGQQESEQQCKPDKPDCQEHFTRCLGTPMADLPGSVYGSNRCLLCRDACVRGGGNWPDIAMTGGRSVRCDYWNYK